MVLDVLKSKTSKGKKNNVSYDRIVLQRKSLPAYNLLYHLAFVFCWCSSDRACTNLVVVIVVLMVVVDLV